MLLLHEAKCFPVWLHHGVQNIFSSMAIVTIIFPVSLWICLSHSRFLSFSARLTLARSLFHSLALSCARSLALARARSLFLAFSRFLHFRARLCFNFSLSRARALSLSLPRFQLISHPYWYLCFSHALSQMACARHGAQCTGLVSLSYRWGQRCPSSIDQVRKLQRRACEIWPGRSEPVGLVRVYGRVMRYVCVCVHAHTHLRVWFL